MGSLAALEHNPEPDMGKYPTVLRSKMRLQRVTLSVLHGAKQGFGLNVLIIASNYLKVSALLLSR